MKSKDAALHALVQHEDVFSEIVQLLFEKKDFQSKSYLHFSSFRESGFYHDNLLPVSFDVMFSARLLNLGKSRYNILLYLYDQHNKYVGRKIVYSFEFPQSNSFYSIKCFVPLFYFENAHFYKFAFELSSGDVLIDNICISSLQKSKTE